MLALQKDHCISYTLENYFDMPPIGRGIWRMPSSYDSQAICSDHSQENLKLPQIHFPDWYTTLEVFQSHNCDGFYINHHFSKLLIWITIQLLCLRIEMWYKYFQRNNAHLDISDDLISKGGYLIWFSCFHINCWHPIRDISTFLEDPSPSVNMNDN